jgi:hypothetical protein
MSLEFQPPRFTGEPAIESNAFDRQETYGYYLPDQLRYGILESAW